jgi:predicted amidohydrolase
VNRLKIAVAQVPSIRGDVAGNLLTHLNAVSRAATEGVDYLVFPELSLTGYEPELAGSLAFSASDKRLAPFIEAANKHDIFIGAGVPLTGSGLPKIGLVIFSPDGTIEIYEKIHLHPGEEKYFCAGRSHHFLHINGIKIANAVCADTNHPEHVEFCVAEKAEVYLAGVLFSEQGYRIDERQLASYAQKHNILVAIANHNAMTGGWKPCGKSAIWSASGKIAAANTRHSALVIAELREQTWAGYVVDL